MAELMIIAAGCMWGSMGLWVRRFSGFGLGSLEILAMRVMVTVITMGVFLFTYNREYMKIRLKDCWCFVGTGILSIVFFGYCYNRTIMMTSMSVAAILLYTAPVFVMVMSRFLFGEIFSLARLTALILAFSGCVLVTGLIGGQNTVSMVGILTGLGSGFGYALYSIFSRYALEKGYHPFTVTWYTFVFALAAVLVLADFSKIGEFWAA
ncbi:MAG: EamA family transporter, partial [Clostridiales bacterium]|nr:EamA family transporter [Candidatus Blautia equi]